MIKRSLLFISGFITLWMSSLSIQAAPIALDRVAAVVEDSVILESQLQERINDIAANLNEQQTQLPPDDVLRKQVLDRLILESIQLQMGDLMGIRVDDNELNETMANIARQNSMTINQFRQQVESEGLPYYKVRDQVRRDMIINQVRQRNVGQRIHVSEQDVENFLNSAIGKTQLAADYRLGHILVPLPENPTPEIVEEADQLANKIYSRLTNNEEDFNQLAVAISAGENALKGGDLGWRQAAQLPTLFADKVIEMGVGDIAPPIRSASGFHIIKVLDKRGGTEMFVEQYKARHILVKPNEIRSDSDAKQLIYDIYKKLQKGDSFSELAKTYSDDPGSARNGGDLGWTPSGVMVPEFDKIMKNAKLNTISEPFQTSFGWHILEVTDKRNQDMSEEFKITQAKNHVFRRKFDEELQVWLREIRAEAFVDIKNPIN